MGEIINLNDRIKTEEQINKLYQELYSIKDKKWTPKEVIDKYELNLDLFGNNNFDPQTKIYQAEMRITTEYANALKQNGNVRKSIPYLNKAVELFDEYSKNKKEEINTNFKAPVYELLIWNRGHSYFLTKNFDLALKDFESLKLNFPEKEGYKMWAKGAKLRKRRKWEWAFVVIFLVAVAYNVLFVKRTDSRSIRDLSLLAMITTGIIFWVVNIWNFIAARRIQKYFDSKL